MNNLFNGVFESPVDERDHVYGNLKFIENGINDKLPEKYMIKTDYLKDQKNSNFCSGYSTSVLAESVFAQKYNKIKEFSPLWLMKISKETDGRPDVTGTYLKNLVKQAVKQGCCEEEFYPTSIDTNVDDNKFPTPSPEAINNSKTNKLNSYAKLSTVNEMKHAIVNNGGCVWATRVYQTYRDHYNRCFVKPPAKGTEPIGGHAIFCIGYDDNLEQYIEHNKYKGFFILQESYGNRGGKGDGLLYVPYQYIEDKVTGFYSVDAFFQEAWCFYNSGDVANENFHDGNEVIDHRTIIELKVDSDIAKINGREVKLSYPATIEQSTTLVPFRFLAEAFNCTVNWISSTKTVSAWSKNMNCILELTIGKNEIKKRHNGNHSTIIATAAPKVFTDKNNGGHTLIPIRAVSEAFECKVDWDSKTKTITIKSII